MPGSTGLSLGGVNALTVRVVTRRSRPYNRLFTATVRSPRHHPLLSPLQTKVSIEALEQSCLLIQFSFYWHYWNILWTFTWMRYKNSLLNSTTLRFPCEQSLAHSSGSVWAQKRWIFTRIVWVQLLHLFLSCLRLLQSTVKRHDMILLLRLVLSHLNALSLLMKLP